MGLGIYMHAESGRRGLFSGRSAPKKLRDDLAELLARQAREALPALKDFIGLSTSEEERLLRLHPADEEVRLSVDGGEVLLSARTNGGGPGYHAFLVRLMDAAAATLGLRWRSGGDDQDETGYFEARDFAALQAEMATWLRALSKNLIEGDAGDGPWLLSMPLDAPRPVKDFAGALSPMGPFDRTWLEETAASSGDDLLARAAEFFPWWEEGAGPSTLHNHGRVLMQQIAWHPPATAEERVWMETAVACLSAGAESAPFPIELAELRALLAQSPDEARPPAPGRVGYRRAEVRRAPFPGVALTVLGYFYDEYDADGTQLYWFSDRTVRISSFRTSRPPGQTYSARSLAQGKDRDVIEEFAIPLAPPADGHCVVSRAYEEGSSYLLAQATFVCPGRIVAVTTTFTDPADILWCKGLLATVHVESPGDD